MRRARLAAAILVSASLLASCASTAGHPTPGGPSFDDGEVRFVAPTGWDLVRGGGTSSSVGVSRIRAYLATQDLRPGCSTTRCPVPLAEELRSGGMLVVWTTNGCVASSCELPAATLIAIGNRQGVHVPMVEGCDGIRFSERSAYYVTVTPQRVDILYLCARDPSDGTRSAFLGFLDAIHWRIP